MKRLQGFEQADLCYEVEVGSSNLPPDTKKEILMTQGYIDAAIVFVLVILWIMFVKETNR